MSEGYEPLLDNQTGEHIGYSFTGDDDVLYACDLDGQVQAYSVDGQAYEMPEPAYVADPDFPGADEVDYAADEAYFEHRLAEIEARVSEPLEVAYRPDTGLTSEQIDNRFWQQAQDLEQQLGRPLLIDERRALALRVSDDADSGAEPDLIAAANDLADAGYGQLLDMDTGHRGADHQARVEFMTARLADGERRQAAMAGEDDLENPVAPPTREYYDMDNVSQRHAFLAERLEGRDVDSNSTYSSSELDQEDY